MTAATDLQALAADLANKDYIASANVWKDRRVYINFAGTDRSFRGDCNARVFFENGEWSVDHGKGTNSRGYDASFTAFHGEYLA